MNDGPVREGRFVVELCLGGGEPRDRSKTEGGGKKQQFRGGRWSEGERSAVIVKMVKMQPKLQLAGTTGFAAKK